MNARNPIPCDIAIVGLGVAGPFQLTREATEIISRCKRTFVADPSESIAEYLRTLCPEVTNLMPVYKPGAHVKIIYRQIASLVVAAAKETSPVCFATYGHPKIYCYPTLLIQRAARVLNLKTHLIPGISLLDTLFAELDVDPGFDGLQVYDATDLVIRRRPIQTDVSCVILQAASVMDPYQRARMDNLSNLALLQNYLLEFYPANHKAAVVLSKSHALVESIKQKIPIGRLSVALRRVSRLAAVYIPPVRHREIADRDLMEKVKWPGPVFDDRWIGIARRPGRPIIGPTPA
jgi:uncharacterized protein YabN with tetrapyrrole methylase and pyrophosphatase domain